MASMASNKGFADRVAAKHIARAKNENRSTANVRDREQGIQQAARDMGAGRITNRDEYRAAREQYRQGRAGERLAAGTPAEYMNKYGSQGPAMYRADQIGQQDKQRAYEARTANIPSEYKEKYGSQAETMYNTDQMNRAQAENSRESFAPASSSERAAGMKESMDAARSSGRGGYFYGAAQQGESALRDSYRKEYAKYGDNPNVIGIKDVQELENRGYSGGEIRRIGLTVGSVGPQAKERIKLITGQPM